MKVSKSILTFIGLLLVVAMIAQARFFSASAMNSPSTKPVVRTDGPRRITAEGRVSTYPGAQVTVGTDTAGTLVRLMVKEKDRVAKGQVIGEIRSEDLRAAIELARTRMKESESDMALYKTELQRAQSLYDGAVGTKQNVDRNRRDLDGAIARHDSAAADVRRLEAVLDKAVIRAPISGTVLERVAQPGEALREQAPVVSIADLKKMRIEAEVDEFDAGRVALGSEVNVRAEGYDNQQWRGRVEEIPDAVVQRKLKPQDPGKPTDTRVLLVKVELLEPTPLKLGQRVEVDIAGK
jgi:RND family efflux transporter MFP subunit